MPDPVASQTGNGTKTNDRDELNIEKLRLDTGWSHQNYANSGPETNKIHFASGDTETESGV